MKPLDIKLEDVQQAADQRDELTHGEYRQLRNQIVGYADIDDAAGAFIVGMFVGAILEARAVPKEKTDASTK